MLTAIAIVFNVVESGAMEFDQLEVRIRDNDQVSDAMIYVAVNFLSAGMRISDRWGEEKLNIDDGLMFV